ncbi:hypothetical protein J3R30DRAFT_3447332 [Lentinula aciculospora]|uniref:DUF6533 domain-containing protein n=1 Tax=Lentinula aciculospora TaxID=153920 RepID=A0A9W9DRS1_9AGAR|nr:hypothetical protein J3R30DRAFT_3447332 [Lentinula aciculospora]
MEALLPSSVLGLLVAGCDFALTRHKEQEYVWTRKKPFRLTFVKCLFILVRYLAFLIHIVNIILSTIWTVKFSDAERPPEEVCRSLMVFQIASSYSMLFLLQMILMLRGLFTISRSTWNGWSMRLHSVCSLQPELENGPFPLFAVCMQNSCVGLCFFWRQHTLPQTH